MCRREIPRCDKYALGHETKERVVSVEKVVCVNCSGTHGAGDQKCLVKERLVEVDRISVAQKVSYEEAVKRVVEEDGFRARDPKRLSMSRPRPIVIGNNTFQ
jgi:hypothetical protein